MTVDARREVKAAMLLLRGACDRVLDEGKRWQRPAPIKPSWPSLASRPRELARLLRGRRQRS